MQRLHFCPMQHWGTWLVFYKLNNLHTHGKQDSDVLPCEGHEVEIEVSRAFHHDPHVCEIGQMENA